MGRTVKEQENEKEHVNEAIAYNYHKQNLRKGYFRNVAALLLIITYLQYINFPSLIRIFILNNKTLNSVSTQPIHHEPLKLSVEESEWTVDGKFNDELFMAKYKCDPLHGYTIKMLSQDPLVLEIENFLQLGEADHIITIGLPLMERSKVVNTENVYHPDRTSSSAFLKKSADKVITCIEHRASLISKLPVANIEPLQVVWYKEGQEYKPHYDYFPPGSDGADRELLRGGQRKITFFGYLSDVPPYHGGETSFPNINLDVPAKKGSAAFWYDTKADGTEDPRTFHGGSKVIGNVEKFGLNIWIRENEFR